MKTKLIYFSVSLSVLLVISLSSANAVQRNIFAESVEQQYHLSQLKVIPIYYADVKEIYKLLTDKKHKLLSENGFAAFNLKLNQLIIQDDQKHMLMIKNFINKIDLPAKQISIRARIVNVETRRLKELGLSFISRTINKTETGLMSNLSSTLSNEMTLPLVKIKDNMFIDLKLNALEQTGHAQILAKPELTTIDRATAFIQSGEEVPYEEKTQSGGTSIIFKKAALELKVTPEILPNEKILLKLDVTQDKVSSVNLAKKPLIHTQKIRTQVLVDNHQTIALGGIFEEMSDKNQQRTSLLSKVPIIGLLFRHRLNSQEHRELIILVTPTIL